MTRSPSDPAWPHLFTGGDDWKVVVSQPEAAAVGEIVETGTNVLMVPRLQLPTDYLIHMHEYRHILRNRRHGHLTRTGHKVRDVMRKMIEEVCVEHENFLLGVDTRRCRDDMDFESRTARPFRSARDAAVMYLQLAYTCGPEAEGGTQNPALRAYWESTKAAMSTARHLAVADLVLTAQKHWNDPVALDEAADWITSRFVETEDPPETPTREPGVTDEDWTTPGEPGEDMPTEDEAGESDDDSEDDLDSEGSGGDDPGDGGEPGEAGRPGAGAGSDSEDEGAGAGEAEGGTAPRERRPAPRFLEDPPLSMPELPGESAEARASRAELEAAEAEALKARSDALRTAGEVSRTEHLTGKTEFGLLDIHRHTMDRAGSMPIGQNWIPRDTGSQVRYPHRLYPTGRVFAVPSPGGSILVDGSGSMSWHQASMEAAMLKFPRLLAAVYSMHHDSYRGRGKRGTGFVGKVCIVAQDGRLGELPGDGWSKPRQPGCEGHSGGNGDADKAALDYMVKHWPRPWVWVSDGQVEAETHGNYPACDLIMRRHKVFRVNTIEDAIAFLAGQAVEGFTACYGTGYKIRRGGPFIQKSIDPRGGY